MRNYKKFLVAVILEEWEDQIKIIHWLTLISDYTKGFYKDSVENDVILYTGMGKIGDQTLIGNQNKTLYESDTNNVKLHIFEVFEKNKYTYKGVVELAYPPFQEIQRDFNGNDRKVWIFPLIKVGDYQTASDILDSIFSANAKTTVGTITEIDIPEFNQNKKTQKKTINKEGYVKDHVGITLFNQLIGDSVVELVLQIEREKLINLGLENYCDKIKRVSLDNETLGFDIISYDKDELGNVYKIFIEVKTTTENEKKDFFISNKEVQIMNELKEKYFIYRLFNINKNPGFYKIRGDQFYKKINLIPKNFIAKIK